MPPICFGDHALQDEALAEARWCAGAGPDRLQPAVDGSLRAGDPRDALRPGACRPGSRRRHHQGDDRAPRDLRSRGGRRHHAEWKRLLRDRRASRGQGDTLRDDCGRLDSSALRHRPDAPGALPARRSPSTMPPPSGSGASSSSTCRGSPRVDRGSSISSRLPEHRPGAGVVVPAQSRGVVGVPGEVLAARSLPSPACSTKAIELRDRFYRKGGPIQAVVAMELLYLLRGCTTWETTLEFIDSLPQELQQQTLVKEQRALAQSRAAITTTRLARSWPSSPRPATPRSAGACWADALQARGEGDRSAAEGPASRRRHHAAEKSACSSISTTTIRRRTSPACTHAQ